jgi:glycosyltransferase involved in cell wall biosynthesis
VTGEVVPRVSIGLPVLNGENYLGEALTCLLGQTFGDLEVIVADEGSTDATEAICRAAAAEDHRVRYLRNRQRLGLARNHNQLVGLARGELFKWASHDDLCAPELLARCVEALDADSRIVGAYARASVVDPEGRPLQVLPSRPALTSSSPTVRCADILAFGNEVTPIFGVLRTAVLRGMRLYGLYPGGDRALLAELALRGPFAEIPDVLFSLREHPGRSIRAFGSSHAAVPLWDARRTGARRVFPHVAMLRDLAGAPGRVGLSPTQRLRYAGVLARWLAADRQWLKLGYDLAIPARPLLDRWWARRTDGRYVAPR